jgi:hypothetical protein
MSTFITVIHLYMILKNRLFNMNLSIFFKNVNMIFNRLQINKTLKNFHFKVNDISKCTDMFFTFTYFIHNYFFNVK